MLFIDPFSIDVILLVYSLSKYHPSNLYPFLVGFSNIIFDSILYVSGLFEELVESSSTYVIL